VTSASLTTRKMSDRHEEDLAEALDGIKTVASGSTWSDKSDGHQLASEGYWRFAWDGKSTLGRSVTVTRDMLTKLREQCRGLEPLLPLRFYRDTRLTMVDEDWAAVELETFAAMQRDANRWRAVQEQGCLIGAHAFTNPEDRSTCTVCGASAYDAVGYE
jgi:hypothetical protein